MGREINKYETNRLHKLWARIYTIMQAMGTQSEIYHQLEFMASDDRHQFIVAAAGPVAAMQCDPILHQITSIENLTI